MCVLVLGFRSAGALGPMHKKYLRRVAAFVDGITRNTSMMNRLADLVITSYIGSTLVMMGAKCSSSSLNVRHRGMIMEHCSFMHGCQAHTLFIPLPRKYTVCSFRIINRCFQKKE